MSSTPARILVVEDDPDLAWLERFALESEGYEVATAADGDQALAAIESFRPRAVVLDLLLPGLDGWSVIERGSMSAVVSPAWLVVSGMDRPQDRARAEEMGVCGYLLKPFDVTELAREVARCLSPR